jgi:hypothetical protein
LLYSASILFIEQIFFILSNTYRANYFLYRAFKFHRFKSMTNTVLCVLLFKFILANIVTTKIIDKSFYRDTKYKMNGLQ